MMKQKFVQHDHKIEARPDIQGKLRRKENINVCKDIDFGVPCDDLIDDKDVQRVEKNNIMI